MDSTAKTYSKGYHSFAGDITTTTTPLVPSNKHIFKHSNTLA